MTEIPYQVNKSKLLQQILAVRDSKKYDLSCITEILDESDRSGTRAVVRVKKDTNIKNVLEILFKETDMQVSYGINMVAIADGTPQLMGILDIIAYYIDYQRMVIYRRTKYDLDIAKEREHILLGLIVAVKNIDEVIKIIKKSEDTSEAKQKLMVRFNLSDRQAQAILDMRLARLTSLEIYKLEQELKEVQTLIEKLTQIINSKKLQFEIIKEEMLEIKKKFKDPRKSVIIADESKYKVVDLDETKTKVSQTVYVALTKNGNLKSLTPSIYSGSSKIWTGNSKLHEVHTKIIKTNTSKKMLIFTNEGNAYKISVDSILSCKWKDKGVEVNKFCDIKNNEVPIAIFEEPDENNLDSILFYTKQGMVKKSLMTEYIVAKSSFSAIKMKEGDELLNVEIDKPDTSIMFVTKLGLGLNSEKSDIPEQGRISTGVKGMLLGDDDELICANQITKGQNIVLVSDYAFAKQINTAELEVSARYRKGVKVFDLKGEKSSGNNVLYAGTFNLGDDIVIETKEGELSSVSIQSIQEDTRSSRGKSLSVEKNKFITMATIKRNM